jgi:flagellar basal-body rod protein FlgC
MDIDRALRISAQGLLVQTTRLRVIAENLANQDTTGAAPGADPYRRKTVTFAHSLDTESGADLVRIARIGQDRGTFPQRYDPSHPAADARGYVKLPNVNSFVEVEDMREAQRSYNANLGVLQTTRGILLRTIELLK